MPTIPQDIEIPDSPERQSLVQLDLARVPARLERPMMAEYLVYDGQHVGRALAVVGGGVAGQGAAAAAAHHVHAVAVLALLDRAQRPRNRQMEG